MVKGIIAVVVVVIVAVGAWLLFGNNNKASAPTTSSTNSTSTSDMANMDSTSSQTSQKAESTNAVMIQNFAFSPASITVKKGTTVTWTNMDTTAHTVTENDGQTGPKSDNLDNGKTYSFTYDTAGTFKYHCSIHPDMTGTVTVTN